MGQKISDATFQKGYQLYQNNQVGPIKQNNNLYSANVRDKQYYHVVIMVNDKHKMTKMNCTCKHARKGETCEHEAALYLKLKSEYLIFENNEDISFKGYYDSKDYDKAIEFLKKQTKKIIDQLRHDNIKQIFQMLTSLVDDYDHMSLSPQYTIEVDVILIKAFRQFLQTKGALVYYLPWMEEHFLNNQQHVASLMCQINNYLQTHELISFYLACLEDKIDEILQQNIMTYLTNHLKELTSEERLFLLKQLSIDSKEYQYIILNQYIEDNKMEEAVKLYEQVYMKLQDYDLKDIEIVLYKYTGDISAYQKYVLNYYRDSHNMDDLSYLKELKDMYGKQWQTAQFVIIEELQDIMGRIRNDILYELSCYEYLAYRYLLSPSKTMSYQLAEYMKNHDFQTYLMMLEKNTYTLSIILIL
ncbi:MAG: exocyst complex component Sec10 [Erysipelotrichaceae bacterium]|nr:exocyst complex component Sec10 [Erysipelotrichaceae bacterium]